MVFRFSVLILCFCCVNVSAKLCPSMDIRSRLRNFEQLKNCTKIAGYLSLVLIRNETVSPYFPDLTDTYPSFPDLKEVTGYLLVFKMPNLYDLGAIFPNLVVIRGRQLLEGSSLIFHHNNQIEKIGLSSLLEIQRGQVHIGKCPNLCYVRTVNWTALGTSLVDHAEVPKCAYHEECAHDCQGHCWAPGRCQKTNDINCHPECLGCEKPGSPRHCTVCKNWKDGDICVKECPTNKFLSDELVECLTEKECRSLEIDPRGHWVFGKWCLPKNTCPEKHEFLNTSKTCKLCDDGICNKSCEGITVEIKEHIEQLKGCTHIEGNLELRVRNIYAADLLAENLGLIKEITGCLKVARSDAVSSLRFFKNLRRIDGLNSTKTCNNHTVFIFENSNLKTLIDVDKIETSGEASIGFHNNPELCLSEIQEFADKLGIKKSDYKRILKEAKDISPFSNGNQAKCGNLILNVRVVENHPRNVTLAWEPHDPSDDNFLGYTVFYIRADILESESSLTCDSNGWNSRFVSTNAINLTQLVPFSKYIYWLKIYNLTAVGGSTAEKTFTTLPDDPSQPLDFKTSVVSMTSINITWDYPEDSNGNLSYYQLIAFVEKDDPKFVNRRNYCLYPHIIESKPTVEHKIDKGYKSWINQTTNNSSCCRVQIFMDDETCGPQAFAPSFPSKNCNKYLYGVGENSKATRLTKRYLLDAKSGPRRQPNEIVIDHQLPAEDTNYILKNLTPFTTYIILFSACNVNFHDKPQCSAVLFSSERTHPNITADSVTDIKLKVSEEDTVSLSWTDPKNPNGMIVAYNIEYKSGDSSRSVYVPECITKTQHVKKKYVHHIKGIDPGTYTIRVRPVSLYGPGVYSESMAFLIKTPMKTWVIYLFVCIVFIILVIVICFYLWYRKKSNFDKVYLITSINPDYQTAVIIEEKWELNRDDVEINELLGQGSFGQVFSGYIKSKNLPCAVKTVNDDASVSYRTEFLKEGCVMKSFSDAYHVIKLYGVVSRNGAPLVIMELMERGDLKQYLRKARDSSGISSPEMYLMASQIADGMSYLAAKKFVHRDLAARNCMVAADRTVKIGDFGMTKDVYETDYYRKGTRELLPVRWMAPESLADGIYSSESDVWSYGIVLWEIVTLAEHPYQGMSNEQVLNFVTSRGVLGRPPQCSDVLWEIMEVCWSHKPKGRPLFLGIVEKLEPLVGPSFALVSFYHSRAGQEYRMNYRQRNTTEVNSYHPGQERNIFEHNSYPHENDNEMLMPEEEIYS